jgi:hypothetical protein
MVVMRRVIAMMERTTIVWLVRPEDSDKPYGKKAPLDASCQATIT